jgi:hypothetical protein
MKKLILLVGLLVAVWLTSCAGPQEALRNDGEGNVKAARGFLEKISSANPELPYYFSADSNWLTKDNGLNDESVGELTDEGDEYSADGMADSSFQMFQVAQDDNGKVNKILWIANITSQPKLKLLRENLPPLTNEEDLNKTGTGKALAGLPLSGNKVVGFWIRAKKLDSSFDDYTNVDARYGQDTRYVISWDKDALGQTDEVKQYDFSNQDGHELNSIKVKPGENTAVVDTRSGKHFMLYSQGAPAMEINPLKREDLRLDGLALVRHDGKFYLEITPPPEPAPTPTLKPLSTMLKESQAKQTVKVKAKHRPVRRHYSLKEKYPNGYYVVEVKELNAQLFDQCWNNHKISLNQKKVIIGKEWFEQYGSQELQERYKDKLITWK